MTPAALIFDLDGTVADTERHGHRVAYNAAFRQAGLEWEWDEALYGRLLAVAGGKERIRHYMEHYHPEFRCPGGCGELVARLHANKTRLFGEIVRNRPIPPRPGVKRLLRQARDAGLRLAIATTTAGECARAVLETAIDPAAPSWFEVIAAGDVVAAKKPAPDIYRHVLVRLGLDAGRCIAFEDSANGLRSARDAGLQTVVTLNDYTRDQDFTGALIVLDHLGEVGRPCRVQGGRPPLFDHAPMLTLQVLQRLIGDGR